MRRKKNETSRCALHMHCKNVNPTEAYLTAHFWKSSTQRAARSFNDVKELYIIISQYISSPYNYLTIYYFDPGCASTITIY